MRLIFPIALIVRCVLVLLCVSSRAQFTYTTAEGKISITGYSGAGGTVIIPDTIDGLPVATIADRAFVSKLAVTNVILGSNVKSVGEFAFADSGLVEITIPNGVTSLGNNSFFDCRRLGNILLPQSLTNIGNTTFEGCIELTTVALPANLAGIGFGPFARCAKLSEISISSDNNLVKAIDGVLYSGDGTTLIQYPAGNASQLFAIPDSVFSVGRRSFLGASILQAIDIPISVTNISRTAFAVCSNLRYVRLPANLTSLGPDAFSTCTKITNVFLPNSLRTIPQGVFSICSALASVTIPSSITNISANVFHSHPTGI